MAGNTIVNVGNARTAWQDVNQSVGMLQRAISDMSNRKDRRDAAYMDTFDDQTRMAQEQTARQVLLTEEKNPTLLQDVSNKYNDLNTRREQQAAEIGQSQYYNPDGTLRSEYVGNEGAIDKNLLNQQERSLYDTDQLLSGASQAIASDYDNNNLALDTVTNPELYGRNVEQSLLQRGINPATAAAEGQRVQKQYTKPGMTDQQKLAYEASLKGIEAEEKAYNKAVNYKGEDHRKTVYDSESSRGGYSKGKYKGTSAQRGYDMLEAEKTINSNVSWTNFLGMTGKMDSDESIQLVKDYSAIHPDVSPEEIAQVMMGAKDDGLFFDNVDRKGAVGYLDRYLTKRISDNKKASKSRAKIFGSAGNELKTTAQLLESGAQEFQKKRQALSNQYGSGYKTSAQLLPQFFDYDTANNTKPVKSGEAPAAAAKGKPGGNKKSDILTRYPKADGLLGQYNAAMRSPKGDGAVLKLVNDNPNGMAQLLSGDRSKREIADFMSVYKGTPDGFNDAFAQIAQAGSNDGTTGPLVDTQLDPATPGAGVPGNSRSGYGGAKIREALLGDLPTLPDLNEPGYGGIFRGGGMLDSMKNTAGNISDFVGTAKDTLLDGRPGHGRPEYKTPVMPPMQNMQTTAAGDILLDSPDTAAIIKPDGQRRQLNGHGSIAGGTGGSRPRMIQAAAARTQELKRMFSGTQGNTLDMMVQALSEEFPELSEEQIVQLIDKTSAR